MIPVWTGDPLATVMGDDTLSLEEKVVLLRAIDDYQRGRPVTTETLAAANRKRLAESVVQKTIRSLIFKGRLRP